MTTTKLTITLAVRSVVAKIDFGTVPLLDLVYP